MTSKGGVRYDDAGRLTTQVESNASNVGIYTMVDGYDAVGNRTSRNANGTPCTWSYDDDYRLTGRQKSGQYATFTYDGNGNMTRVQDFLAGTTTMAYDGENRLSVLQTASSLATYLYDGDGRKRVEIGAFGRTTLVWDGWDYFQAYSGSKPLDYHTVDGLILAQRFDEDYAEYLPDFLGSVAAYADESGSVQAEARYKPYGSLLWSDGLVGDYAFGWVGQWGYRTAQGWMYVRRRHYSPYFSTWSSSDPLQDGLFRITPSFMSRAPITLSITAYSFNPVTAIDPTGMSPETAGENAPLNFEVGFINCIRQPFPPFPLPLTPPLWVTPSLKFCRQEYDTRCCAPPSATSCVSIGAALSVTLAGVPPGLGPGSGVRWVYDFVNQMFGAAINMPLSSSKKQECVEPRDSIRFALCLKACLGFAEFTGCPIDSEGPSAALKYGFCGIPNFTVSLAIDWELCA